MTLFRSIIATVFLFLFLLLSVLPASAHKVRVFAYIDGNSVVAEGAFSGGRPAKGATVTAENAENHAVLFTGKTDAAGICRISLPKSYWRSPVSLLITLSSGDGHQATWILDQAESKPIKTADAPAPAASEKEAPTAVSTDDDYTPSASFIREIVREELARQLVPVQRELAVMGQQKPSVQDVVGGIGYIVGLAGLIAYMNARKKGEKG